jgi:uncharacterized integral membrane protein
MHSDPVSGIRTEAMTVTTDPTSSRPVKPKEEPPTSEHTPAERSPRPTRASAAWGATAAALVLLVMLIVFILQNSERVQVRFFGFSDSLPLGMALFIAAVGGGVVVAIAGAARVTQLRINARRTRHANSGT